MTEKKLYPQNQIFEIPVDGSLGLLALGAVGLKAWRKKREEVKKRNESKEQGPDSYKDSENKSSTENKHGQ